MLDAGHDLPLRGITGSKLVGDRDARSRTFPFQQAFGRRGIAGYRTAVLRELHSQGQTVIPSCRCLGQIAPPIPSRTSGCCHARRYSLCRATSSNSRIVERRSRRGSFSSRSRISVSAACASPALGQSSGGCRRRQLPAQAQSRATRNVRSAGCRKDPRGCRRRPACTAIQSREHRA